MIVALKRAALRFVHASVRNALSLLPDRLVVIIHGHSALLRRLDHPRVPVMLMVGSEIELRTRLRSCSKEPELVAWIENDIRAGDVLYDIGANVGTYALLAAALGSGRVQVYCFEPGATTFAQLCRNIAANSLAEVMYPFQIALADRTGTVAFNYASFDAGGALHALGEAVDWKGDTFAPVYRQPVLAYRLDEFRERFSLAAPTHIKVDVDGGELGVFRGAGRTLDEAALRGVFVELEEGTAAAREITELLERRGFRLDHKFACVPAPHDGRVSRLFNFVFRRERAAV